MVISKSNILFFSTLHISYKDHIKRKIRRRSSWGRGIIRKKKSYKKGVEEEEDEPEAEVEAAGPSDSCLTQDEESSCDITGPQPNGHHPHLPSTEEESSEEPPLAAPTGPPTEVNEAAENPASERNQSTAKEGKTENTENQTKQSNFEPLTETSESSDAELQSKHTGDLTTSHVDCVNGNESMDSLDSVSLRRSSEDDKGTPQGEAGSSNKSEQRVHKDKLESHSTQGNLLHHGRAGAESADEDQDREGMKSGKLVCVILKYVVSVVFFCYFSPLKPFQVTVGLSRQQQQQSLRR